MESKAKIYIALVHYPVTNKTGKMVATAITNFDIHDIARTARTFGVENYFLVTPLESQIMLTERILGYWANSDNPHIIPDRQNALSRVKVVTSITGAIDEIVRQTGKKPLVITTSAKENGPRISYSGMRKQIETTEGPYLLLFGTGYGLSTEVLEGSDFILEPIRGADDFNHLSVRAATAIILDRLLGEIRYSQESKNQLEIQTIKESEESYASHY
jgi:hypothetical protein